MSRLGKLQQLILLSALFMAGVILGGWSPPFDALHFWPFATWDGVVGRWEPVFEASHVWLLGSYVLAAVISIHGSWQIIPIMALGFFLAEILGWSLFFSGHSYHPRSDDAFAMLAFGCNIAALFGSRWLIAHRHQLKINNSSKIAVAVPVICFGIALFFTGRFVALLCELVIDHFPSNPELASIIVSCLFGFGLLAGGFLTYPRIVEAKNDLALPETASQQPG